MKVRTSEGERQGCNQIGNRLIPNTDSPEQKTQLVEVDNGAHCMMTLKQIDNTHTHAHEHMYRNTRTQPHTHRNNRRKTGKHSSNTFPTKSFLSDVRQTVCLSPSWVHWSGASVSCSFGGTFSALQAKLSWEPVLLFFQIKSGALGCLCHLLLFSLPSILLSE